MTRFTRRSFLQGSVAGGLALAQRGRRAAAAPFTKPLGANDDIRVAVIGLGQLGAPGVGARGRQLIDRLREVSGVRIVALCDVDTQILDREVQRFEGWQQRVKSYTDMRDVFDDHNIDAVFIATPNHWHWIWATGNGEIGNNGVHYLDRCRWLLGQNGLPRRAMSIGGRFALNDDGQTANTQIAILDYDPAPVICEVRGLPEKAGSKKMDKFGSIATGIIIQCEGGSYVGTRAGAIYDNKGREIKAFTDRREREKQASVHQANFVEAMRSRKPGDLNADIQEGHLSAALCHMANVSHRLGERVKLDAMIEATKANAQWSDAFERFRDHLGANGVDIAKTPAVLGPWLTMDSDTETFIGEFAEQANELSRRGYREPFIVPEII